MRLAITAVSLGTRAPSPASVAGEDTRVPGGGCKVTKLFPNVAMLGFEMLRNERNALRCFFAESVCRFR